MKRNFHRIWIAMEKLLVKRGPGPQWVSCEAGHVTLWIVDLIGWSSGLFPFQFNSLTPGRFDWNLRWVIYKVILVITLVQVMTWCRQTTSHCLKQCWPKSMSPYGITRPQWDKGIAWNNYTMFSIVTSGTNASIVKLMFFIMNIWLCFLLSVTVYAQIMTC